MATSTSSFGSSLEKPSEKLTRTNYPLWRAQVLPSLRGAQLFGIAAGTEVMPPKIISGGKDKTADRANPEYEAWFLRDQQVLSYLVNSLSKEILTHVIRYEHAAQVWKAVEDMFASQSRSKITNLRIAIANTKKLHMTTPAYFSKMSGIADELAAAGKALDDEEIVSFILAGLGPDYDGLVGAIGLMTTPISVTDLYAQVLAQDQRQELQGGSQQGGFESSANAALRSRGGDYCRGSRPPPRGSYQQRDERTDQRQDRQPRSYRGGRGAPPSGGRGRGRGRRRTCPWVDITCQICLREGHAAKDCWHRYQEDQDADDPYDDKEVHNASYGVDTNWYPDTGATHHITSELNHLTVRDKYKGHDKVNTASGQGMDICHVGHSVVRTPPHNFQLRNILHVPNASKNLLSVHRFTLDNHVFIEFHPSFFLIKDQATRNIIHRGRCVGGLYPLISSSVSSNEKQAFAVTKPSHAKWHSRLGHPSFAIVRRVISKNKLPFVRTKRIESICDPCQKAKSHQLPYPISTSVSTAPLQLVFTDVWGPAPTSVGRHDYYVSFIDDYSKFTWIYLLKRKSDVFSAFTNFQKLVERKLDSKILTIQSDWGGEYEKLNSFFQTQGIAHHVSCPHAHQQNGSAERKHRHIVEVGLALLANASMPLKFWDEAFLTATYLINMLPSKVINYDTPVHRLLNSTPDYASLRVFGCACWPNLRPYNKRKLAFRSKRCVFLGYSPLHKGVKCLDISMGRVYISRNVVFDESIFPFEQLHPNAGALLRKDILLLDKSLHGGEHTNDSILTNIPSRYVIQPLQETGTNLENNGDNLSENGENLNQNGDFDHISQDDEISTESKEDSGTESASDQEPSELPPDQLRIARRSQTRR